VPQDVLQAKIDRYQKNGEAIQRTELIKASDYSIVLTYQLEFRGIANYYQLAYNMRTLAKLKWVMETSLTKTLASKHKISVSKVYEKYGAMLLVGDTELVPRLLADFCELCGSDKDVEVHHVNARRKKLNDAILERRVR
jgi:hypothetical protein